MIEVKISSEIVRFGEKTTTIEPFEAHGNLGLQGYLFKCADIDQVVSNDSFDIGMCTMQEVVRKKLLKI